jgi:hypothetical protein
MTQYVLLHTHQIRIVELSVALKFSIAYDFDHATHHRPIEQILANIDVFMCKLVKHKINLVGDLPADKFFFGHHKTQSI